MSLRDAMLNSWFLPESFYRKEAGFAYPDQAEFICPQAFGRNTYSDRRVSSILHVMRGAVSDPIRRFEWLKERGFDPGTPNRILARRCIGLATARRLFVFTLGGIRTTSLPVIGQWEVLYAMWLHEPDWYAKHQDILIPIWQPITGRKWTPRDMMWDARDIAEARGLRVPLIVAHPEHVQRCFFIARKVFGIAATDHIDGMVLEEWFDRHSVQKQTTSPSRWLAYEMRARIHHRLHSWI